MVAALCRTGTPPFDRTSGSRFGKGDSKARRSRAVISFMKIVFAVSLFVFVSLVLLILALTAVPTLFRVRKFAA